MRTCKVCSYLRLHPFTKVLLIVFSLMTLSMKNNLLFLMNNLNHKNIGEYVDNRQQTNNLVELMGTDDINYLSLIIMSHYDDCEFALIN